MPSGISMISASLSRQYFFFVIYVGVMMFDVLRRKEAIACLLGCIFATMPLIAQQKPLTSGKMKGNTMPESSLHWFSDSALEGSDRLELHGQEVVPSQNDGIALKRRIFRYFRKRPNLLIAPDGSHRYDSSDGRRMDYADFVVEYRLSDLPRNSKMVKVAIFHGGAATADKADLAKVREDKIEVAKVLDQMVAGMKSDEVFLAIEKPLRYMEDSARFNCGFLGGAVRLPFVFSRVSGPLERWLEDFKAWAMTTRVFGRPFKMWSPVRAELQLTHSRFQPESEPESSSKQTRRISFIGVPRLNNPISAAIHLLLSNPTRRQGELNNVEEYGFFGEGALDTLRVVGGQELIHSERRAWEGVTQRRWEAMLQVFRSDKRSARIGVSGTGKQFIKRDKNTTGAVYLKLELQHNGYKADAVSATTTDGLNGAPSTRFGDSATINGGTAKVIWIDSHPYAVSFSSTGTGANIVRGSVADILGELRLGKDPVLALMDKLVELQVDDLGIVMVVANLETGEVRAYSGSNTPPPYAGFPMGVAFMLEKDGQEVLVYDQRLHIK